MTEKLIAIKGFQMPYNCIECPIQFGGWCGASPPEIDERVAETVDEAVRQKKPKWCPLVESEALPDSLRLASSQRREVIAMTIEDAIKHCRDTALSNAGNAIAYLKGGQKMLAESCEKCAAEHEQLAQWLEELKQRRDAERWIPCSERLPETGTDVIVYYPYWYKSPVQIAHLNGDFWESSDGEYDFPVKAVTHWKPLPEPPEVNENA